MNFKTYWSDLKQDKIKMFLTVFFLIFLLFILIVFVRILYNRPFIFDVHYFMSTLFMSICVITGVLYLISTINFNELIKDFKINKLRYMALGITGGGIYLFLGIISIFWLRGGIGPMSWIFHHIHNATFESSFLAIFMFVFGISMFAVESKSINPNFFYLYLLVSIFIHFFLGFLVTIMIYYKKRHK